MTQTLAASSRRSSQAPWRLTRSDSPNTLRIFASFEAIEKAYPETVEAWTYDSVDGSRWSTTLADGTELTAALVYGMRPMAD
jgi:hypothetical protein